MADDSSFTTRPFMGFPCLSSIFILTFNFDKLNLKAVG